VVNRRDTDESRLERNDLEGTSRRSLATETSERKGLESGGYELSVKKSTGVNLISVSYYKNITNFDSTKVDVTQHVKYLKLDYSMQRPWENLNLTLVFPDGMFNWSAPAQGSWIVVEAANASGKKEKTRSAVFLGYVKEVTQTSSVASPGVISSWEFNLTAVSWLEAHATNQVITALIAKETIGTFFSGAAKTTNENSDPSALNHQWNSIVDAIISAANPKDPLSIGKSAAKLWELLGSLQLPPPLAKSQLTESKFGARCGSVIPFVYDNNSASKVSSRLQIDPVPGWSIEGIKSILPNGQSTVDMLMGSYQADFNLVEMFPVMEPLELNKEYNELATNLNAQPAIVYRMKPWRAMTIEEYLTSEYTVVGQADGVKQYDKKIFTGTTWHKKNEKEEIIYGFSYPANMIQSITTTETDHDHINSVSVNLPGHSDSAVQWLSQAGLPIQFKNNILHHGVRHFSPRWPFFPPMSESFLASLFTIATLACQFTMLNNRFARGTCKLAKYCPELRVGMTVELELLEPIKSGDYEQGSTVFTCYVDTVNHEVSVIDNSKIVGSTTFGFSRGSAAPRLHIREIGKLAIISGELLTEEPTAPTQTAPPQAEP
jgi:hypothetical protein